MKAYDKVKNEFYEMTEEEIQEACKLLRDYFNNPENIINGRKFIQQQMGDALIEPYDKNFLDQSQYCPILKECNKKEF